MAVSTPRDFPRIHVILNADDFGRSSAINAAIIQAHRHGVLTGASLMVSGDARAEAVELARATPTLAVGLHLVLVDGQAVLPHKDIPHLVESRGRFSANPLEAGLRYFFSPTARVELAREIAAQFERFASLGLALSHVDGHQHFHVHPAVFDLLLPLAEQYGASGVRLPRDDLCLALRYDRRQAGVKIAWAFAFALLNCWCQKRMRCRRLVAAQRVYGLMQSGQMRVDYVVRVLQALKVPSAELYFHPSLEPQKEPLGPNPGDLATLLDPAVRQVIAERNLSLATYPTLAEVQQNA